MAAKRKAAARSSKAATAPRQTEASEPAPPPQPMLSGQVALSDRKKLAAADFYSALQRGLDTVQRQLSSANNAFADFVVKEFKVDAAVQMSLNDLGVLQLVLADDTTTAQSVSRLSLTLGAVAKAPDGSSPRNTAIADATALADLTWLPPELAAQLATYEIKTASEFLGLAADARFATQIISLLKVRRADVGRWTNQIRLLELPLMTVEYIRVLGELGIYAFPNLAILSDKDIADLQLKAPKTLTAEMLVKWREAAKSAMQ